MIGQIIKLQLKERFTHWMSIIFFLMLVFQGVWYTKGSFDYYANDGILMNAPAIFYKNFAGLGMLMVIIIVILTGGLLYKDIQHKTGQWMYALPVNEKKFFLGRFLSAFLINLLLSTGYFVGMLLVPYSGIGEAHRFGPTPIGQMLHAVLIFLIPNLFFFSSLIFFALVYSRKMAVGYLAAFVAVIIFLVMQSTGEGSGFTKWIVLLDPNGYTGIQAYLEDVSTAEKNTGYLVLKGDLLLNRIIWLSVSLVLVSLAYLKFSYKYFIQAGKSQSRKIAEKGQAGSMAVRNREVPLPEIAHDLRGRIKKVFNLTVLEFFNIVRPSSFRIIIGIVVLMVVLQNLMWNASYYIGPEVPVTSNLTYFRLPWGVFIIMLLMIWSGELFFKDRTANIWQITNALPVPVWVSQLSKLFAMIGVSLILCLTFIVVGVAIQVFKGSADLIDWGRYADDVLGFRYGWLTYSLEICLVFFIAGLTGNRFITHILSVGTFLIFIISFDMGLMEQVRYAYPFTPGVDDYSEMSGYGIFKISAEWFFFMWVCLAVVFVMLGIQFWNRGTGSSLLKKITFAGDQLRLPAKLVVVLFLGVFLFLQSFIGKQAYDKGNFVSEAAQDAEDADYEKAYQYLKRLPQPKYSQVDLRIDYHTTSTREVNYKAGIVLVNESAEPVKKLILCFEDFVEVRSLSVDSKVQTPLKIDDRHHVFSCELDSILYPGEKISLNIEANKSYVGFTQSGENPQGDITFNGSFGNVKDFLPVIGYDYNRELDENRTRQDEGLEKLASRMPAWDDDLALSQDLFAPDANWVKGSITLSTDQGQTGLAPGRLIKQWKENERNYFQYQIDSLRPFDWHVGCSRYRLHAEGQQSGTSYQIWGNEKHPFNISLYDKAIKGTLDFLNQKMGDYPYDQLRIMEINNYDEKFCVSPNLIAISEKEGWFADTTGLNERAYIYQTVASLVFRHFIQSRVHIANVQGADMLSIALPEALALEFVKELLGEEAFEKILKKKQDFYGKERNNDPNGEPSLLYADGPEYLEINKGAIALNKVINKIGIDSFSQLLTDWCKVNQGKFVRFQDFYIKFSTQISNKKEFEEVI